MLARFRPRRPSPAMVVALIALFAALGGSSYAAIKLANNSVSSKHIRNGQVKKRDLGRNSVDSSKVGNGALRAEDFAPGQIPAGERGPQGPAGANGTNGANGLNGAALAAAARCSACPISSSNSGQPVGIPLSDDDWTQDATEANAIVMEATYTPAPSCSGSGFGDAGAVRFFLDGDQIGVLGRDAGQPMETERAGGGMPFWVFATGAAEPHELTATITDNCSGGENASVQNVKVDVMSLLR